jgi:hypothetical protein
MPTETITFQSIKELFQVNAQSVINSTEHLFVADVSKDDLWNAYLLAFPESERQGFNCNSCRQFIKQYGNIVVVDANYQRRSLWNLQVPDPLCQAAFDRLDALVTAATIRDAFVADTAKLGTDSNLELLDSGQTWQWHHLSLQLPSKFVISTSGDTLATIRGDRRSQKEVLKRSLDELTITATQTALELIASNSIYRGAEFKGVLEQFAQLQNQYAELLEDVKDNFCWVTAAIASGGLSKIRNTAIGTFLVDLSNDLDINEAVNRFERVMAPANYKRPTPVFTKRMVEDAERKVADLGLVNSLARRHATLHDLTVNNLLFVDRSVRTQTASVFDTLKQDVQVNPKKFDKVQDVFLETFINDILPTAQSIELLLENKHQNKLVSLIAPVNPDAPSLFKWSNAFSWSYAGAYADSVKQRVKKAGGEIEGQIRISLAWSNTDDLDLHLVQPKYPEVYYVNKRSLSGWELDVDMNVSGDTREPVENIFFPNGQTIPEGTYRVVVHQYKKRERVDVGFTLEIEHEGNIQVFEYPHELREKEQVHIVDFAYSVANGLKISGSIQESTKVRSKEFWGLRLPQFHKVNAMMFSPNHWVSEKGIGNKHLFVVLDNCQNDEPTVRGFFNEFLKEELTPHRKVFEAIANKMEVANNVGDKQLSGVGFSLTQPADFIVRVKGATERVMKVVV